MGIKKIQDYSLPDIGEITNKIKWDVEAENTVLLIHDMQVYFANAFHQKGEPYLTVMQNIQQIKKECVKKGIPVIYSAQPEGQSHEQRGLLLDFWGNGIPAGEKVQNIIEELMPDEKDIVMKKWRYSAFENTKLEQILTQMGKSQLIITGIYAHIGCLTTSIAASMKNIKPFMISDATADFSRSKHQMALEYVSQLTGMVLDTKQLISELSK